MVEVQDNGPGIPPEVMPRIFDPFFSTKPKQQGSGLGLPITREIIEAHGGRIEVESERGRGALFRVRLPIREEPWESDRRVRVLVIDDDEGVARAIQRARFAGHEQVAVNADAEGDLLDAIAALTDEAARLLADVTRKFRLSARAYHRVLRVARTIADLEGSGPVARPHVAEAAGYRLAL